jgi:predicted GH43/DUF377 family glycosyl hydrolase
MRWEKKGTIFVPSGQRPWMRSHASIPICDYRANGLLRIYFGTRDDAGRSHIGWVDVEADAPTQVHQISESPLLNHGPPGTFDDSGIMPSWLLEVDGRKYLYYIGWNPQVTVSYRLSIGLAISDDGGDTFVKLSKGPVSDRSFDEPFFNTAPCVRYENGLWRMWYISCTEWETVNDWPEPRYHVRYAESKDGINWRKTGIVCIDYDANTGAVGRPCVFVENGIYKMLYSYRGVVGYRTDPHQSYRLGYAESLDGIRWTRKDGEVGISRSEHGWDSEMMEYCSLFQSRDDLYMFYNGNGFGKTGFGYAVRIGT